MVTHEHTDHIKSLGNLSKKFNLPVFATPETFDAMPKQSEKISDANKKNINIDESFSIKDITIKPFAIPHDAANPCGFTFIYNGTKMSIATDIGHMNLNILNKLEGSSFILLESNYDPDILKCSSYPYYLKQRIMSNEGHLPNKMAGKTIAYLLNSGLNNVVLGHLSKENNFPELAYKTVVEELMNKNFDENSIKISIADRNKPSNNFKIN